jgi:hypothetical protein
MLVCLFHGANSLYNRLISLQDLTADIGAFMIPAFMTELKAALKLLALTDTVNPSLIVSLYSPYSLDSLIFNSFIIP